MVNNACVHDSQVIGELLGEKDKGEEFYAESANTGEKAENIYKEKEVINLVHEKGYKNNPLNEAQKANNKEKSTCPGGNIFSDLRIYRQS